MQLFGKIIQKVSLISDIVEITMCKITTFFSEKSSLRKLQNSCKAWVHLVTCKTCDEVETVLVVIVTETPFFVAKPMADTLTDDQKQELKEAFSLFDKV